MFYYIRNFFKTLILIRTFARFRLLWDINLKHYSLRLPLRLLNVLFSPLSLIYINKASFGTRLADCFYKLGPIYIKLGQTLSTRPDIIGEEIANDLSLLQDKLKPFPIEDVDIIFKKEFGRNKEEIFEWFDPNAIASASVAQVHKAKTKDGRTVACKLLRPNIERLYEADIKFLHFIASIINKFKSLKRLRAKEIVKVLKNSMDLELDLRFEGAASSELKSNFANDNTVTIPSVYWEYTTKRILTTDYINGISLYDTEKLNKLNRKEIASKIAILFFNQVYRDGYFHADMHPGNIIIEESGRIGLVDFGIMGRLSEKDRIAFAEILHGFLKKDYLKVAEIHIDIKWVPENTDKYLFAQACRAIGEPIVGHPVNKISVGDLIGKLFSVAHRFSMETQPQLVLLQKTLITVEAIGKMLDPEINIWLLAEKWIKKWAAKNLSLEARILKYIKRHIENALKQI